MTGCKTEIEIAGRGVGPGKPCYVIAEIGSNHNQDKSLALDMIDMAAESGCDAVKFQSIRFDRLYSPALEDSAFRENFRRIELDETWYADLAARARKANLHFLSAPTYIEAIPLLLECGVAAFKLASPQVFGNHDVVREAARTGLPLLMSFGYSEYGDIAAALKICTDEGNDRVVPLHCVSKYPAAPEDINLRFMRTLAAMAGRPAGFSDHSQGTHLALAAVALGACAIEKHVTVDTSMPGPDHHFALIFGEFATMVRQIRETEAALGTGTRLDLLPEESELRQYVRLKIFAQADIAQGDRIESASLECRRASADGIAYDDRRFLEHCRARTAIPAGSLIQWSMLEL